MFLIFFCPLLSSWSATLQSISQIRVKYQRYLVCGHIEYLEHTYVLCLAFIGRKTSSVSSFLDFCALQCFAMCFALAVYTVHWPCECKNNFQLWVQLSCSRTPFAICECWLVWVEQPSYCGVLWLQSVFCLSALRRQPHTLPFNVIHRVWVKCDPHPFLKSCFHNMLRAACYISFFCRFCLWRKTLL